MARRTATTNAGKRKTVKLSKEALKLVDEKADLIAKALYDSTIAGHVLSARLLVDLAEGNVDVDEALNTRPMQSIAVALALEPHWSGDDPEGIAEADNPEPGLKN
jgi:hypothetical protein